MTDKKYNTKLAEDTAKRFRMLCEYTFNITEDDGEEMPMGNQDGMPPQESPEQQEMPQGEPNPEQGMGNPNEMQGDMQGGMEGAPGFNPDENAISNDMDGMENTESMQSDDEVIDVDDLTDSQEETEKKVEEIQISMEKGFEKLINIVDKLSQMIDTSTQNMENIKHEIEERNPTPLEKLNMRAANDSYPFNISPSDYWREKEMTSNYRIGGENEEDAKQYTITQGDIDSITDYQQISKELNSSELNQNLLNIFGLH